MARSSVVLQSASPLNIMTENLVLEMDGKEDESNEKLAEIYRAIDKGNDDDDYDRIKQLVTPTGLSECRPVMENSLKISYKLKQSEGPHKNELRSLGNNVEVFAKQLLKYYNKIKPSDKTDNGIIDRHYINRIIHVAVSCKAKKFLSSSTAQNFLERLWTGSYSKINETSHGWILKNVWTPLDVIFFPVIFLLLFIVRKRHPVSRAEQSRAEQSRAEQSRAEQSRAEQSRAEQSRAEQSRAEQSRAEQSRAEQSRAEQSRAEQSRAEQSRAEQSRAEQSRAEQSRAEQSRAEQSRAESSESMERVWKEYGKSMERVWKEYGKSMERVWKEYGKSMERVWKEYGKSMERVWKEYGKSMERVEYGKSMERVWKEYGKSMERVWKEYGKSMERVWKEYGKSMERVWIEYGKSMERVWKEYGKSMERVWKEYGKSMERVWKEYGKSMERVWKEYGKKSYKKYFETPYFIFLRDFFSYLTLLLLHCAVCVQPTGLRFSALEWIIMVFFVGRILMEFYQGHVEASKYKEFECDRSNYINEEEMAAFKENLVAINTKKKSTNVAVRRFKSWYKEKYGEEVNLEQISKNEAPKLLKHLFLEIRQTTKENKGKEYEPGTLQTYRNGLRRYFLERQCPPAVDNFDIEKGSGTEFEEVAEMLSLKKKDLKKKGFGNKPNTAQPIEDEDVQKMWESGAVGMHSPRALLRLVWWNNMMHLGMRGFQEQRDCQLEDFLIKDTYIEYNERQTKNRQGDEESSNKRARKYNNKIWKTDGGERDPYQAFIEYLNRHPKGDNVPSCFFCISC
ncbi:hypothetical protein QZH41_005333 [Actinostola sp. cb2023]|nr:hypothetical protein QZH41_005333 [Actinostola sp. cb2023]